MAKIGLKPGGIYTRVQVKALLGGSTQGGIVPSKDSKAILVYSDHASGKRFGYIDGWLAEDDDGNGPIFEYTGAGNQGDQSFRGRTGAMNKSLFQHADDGRALHLFTAVGTLPGTDTKTHRYIGQMILDESKPYVIRQASDEAGNMRKTIVFRLRSVDGCQPESQDDIPPAVSTRAIRVPADITTSAIIPPENTKVKSSRRSGSASTNADRREAELADHYLAFLTNKGHFVQRIQITIKGLTSPLLTDLYDVTDHVLYEAKGAVSRDAVRLAIGQLMDYRRHVKPSNPILSVLLPAKPHDDLVDLIVSAGVFLVYRQGESYAGNLLHL
jgi:hypothetical protein